MTRSCLGLWYGALVIAATFLLSEPSLDFVETIACDPSRDIATSSPAGVGAGANGREEASNRRLSWVADREVADIDEVLLSLEGDRFISSINEGRD